MHTPANGSAQAVAITGLHHRFGAGALQRAVLTDIHLQVKQGEIVVLTGPSGSGKTTLLTLIGGLRATQQGSLRVLGRELCGADERTRTLARREHGYIFQAHNLHESLTACRNVRLALEMTGGLPAAEMDARASAMLNAVGLEDHLHAHPRQLSGGQKQRVAVARALVGNPRLVLADEPTAALDSQSGRAVVDLLQTLARQRGTTTLLVTHDHRILDAADRIVTIEDGALVGSR